MFDLRKAVGAVALVALTIPAAAASASMPNVTPQPSRFSGPGVYTGAPDLPLTLSMVIAGGGPAHFSSVTLVKGLTGPLFGAELAKLTKQYGKNKVGNFVTVFNYVVSDSLRIVTMKHVALPKSPSPDPANGKALAAALWHAGQTGSGFSVEVMLDKLVSHPIHVTVMDDIDRKYGIAQDAQYHAILNTAMHDLASAYHLSAMGSM